jgi:hypothetical protein
MRFDDELNRIASCWAEMTKMKDDCPDDIFDIGFQLNTLAYDQPEEAWEIIKMIIATVDREKLVVIGEEKVSEFAANLGSGPLEVLIAQNGEKMMDKIEEMASTDDRLAWILGCVWKNGISDDNWIRVKRAAGGISR